MWSKADENEIYETWARGPGDANRLASLLAIATRAVELKAASGGTHLERKAKVAMRAMAEQADASSEQRADADAAFDALCASHGARVAVLEASQADLGSRLDALAQEKGGWEEERAALEAEVERLSGLAAVTECMAARREKEQAKQSEAVWRQRLNAAADELADVGAGECGRLDIVTRVRMLKARLPTETVDEAATPKSCDHELCGVACTKYGPARYPCSASCTHDDAATPGHAERVKARSEEFIDAGDGPLTPAEEAAAERAKASRTFDDGAEAMRAACWEAVQEEFPMLGLGSGERQRLKAAIEGAVP